MMDKRSKWLALFFVVLLVSAIYSLLDRMVIQRQRYLSSSYTDKAYVDLIERLISEGVFITHYKKVLIDENALKSKGLKKLTEERIRNSLPYLYAKAGKIHFDKQSVFIANSRIFADERISRGKILDRESQVLAWSAVDEKTWKQERKYFFGPQFFHIIGYSDSVYGKRNLEGIMDDYLSGKGHLPIYRETDDPLKNFQLGDDIILTLDANIQKRAYDLMGEKRGAVVVIDVKTGEILAAVSTPSFDPTIKKRSKWREAFDDDREKPYQNRAFSVLYPPGSTFKTVVASAWLEDTRAEVGNNRKVFCNGKKNVYGISDIHVHGNVDLDNAYAQSCNLFFSEVGVTLGHQLLEYSRGFGFNKKWNLVPQMEDYDFSSEKSTAFTWDGNNQEAQGSEFEAADFKRNPKLIAQAAIGQNLVMATPLQMAVVAATVANRGVLLNPYIVKEILTGDGKKVLFYAKPVEVGRALKEKTALKIKGLMEEVMRGGTGKDVKKIYFVDGKYATGANNGTGRLIPVAGKTGTAEAGDKNHNGHIDPDEKPHSWFIGFAPVDSPRFAIAVVAENQGFGSLTAAPIAMDVLAEALNTNTDR